MFGGESAPALRRVAEYGNGWCGFNLTPDEAAAKIRRIEELLKANGRKRSDVEIAVSPYSKPITKDDLKRYRDAGVDEVVLITLRPPRAEAETIEQSREDRARLGRAGRRNLIPCRTDAAQSVPE